LLIFEDLAVHEEIKDNPNENILVNIHIDCIYPLVGEIVQADLFRKEVEINT
jgi:hypothetical protein